jgi:F-type H+-transporting ATPase subunit delta
MTEEVAKSETANIGYQQIGSVYAKALLGAISSTDRARTVIDDFRAIIDEVLVKHPALRAVFASPRVAPEEKSGIIDRVFGGRIDQDLLKFLQVVCRHGRLDALQEIYKATRKQFNEAHGIVEVQVTTATPIDPALADRIRTALSAHLNHQVELITKTDGRLIGGMVVRVGDRVYDASVAQQLVSMRKTAVERAVQQMKDSTDRFVSSVS